MDKQQYFKATDPEASVYVDASAGSGKTKILIDRITRLLLYGVKPSKILCVTFTNAATGEMIERLHNILFLWLTVEEEALKDALYALNGYIPSDTMLVRARSLFHKCIEDGPRIQTIHSFCSTILQRMFVISSIDEADDIVAKIINDEEKLDLLRNTFNKVVADCTMDNYNSNVRSALETLLDKYSISSLFELVIEFWEHLLSSGDKLLYDVFTTNYCNNDILSEDIATMLKARIHGAMNVPHDMKDSTEIVLEYIESCDLGMLQRTISILLGSKNVTSQNAGRTLDAWLSLNGLARLKEFDKYIDIFLTSNYEPKSRLPLNAEMCKKYPEIKDFLIQEQKILYELWKKVCSKENVVLNAAFSVFTWYVLQKYNAAKKLHYLFEYGDLVRQAVDLIQGNGMGLLYSIDVMVDHIMIDEAQDFSAAQWSVIQKISEEFYSGVGSGDDNRTIFIVGDFKQAIFSFQGAAPKIFQDIKSFYRQKFHQANKKWYEIQLKHCFRCAPEVLRVVDLVCNLEKVKKSFGIMVEDIKHTPVHADGHGIIALHNVSYDESVAQKTQHNTESGWMIPGDKPKHDIWYDNEMAIAKAIANNIALWCSGEKTVGPENLKVEPQDILILLRKRSRLQNILVDELRKLSVPTTNLAARRSSNDIAIYDMMSIIYFAVQPLDDMNLVALLKSPLFSFSDAMVMEVCVRRHGFLWEEICMIAECDLDQIQDIAEQTVAKVQQGYTVLKHIIYMSQLHDEPQVFCQWYLDYFADVLDSSKSQLIINYAVAYNNSARKINHSLHDFILWMKGILNSAQHEQYDRQSVRITTVHAAKGLEAPVVILADASSTDNTQRDKFLRDENWFILNNSNHTAKNLSARHKENIAMENMRLLYVALTRAKYELHIFGYEKNSTMGIDMEKSDWYSIIKRTLELKDYNSNEYQ